jgi:ParB-like chromosome segregation protein Spo0J
MKTQRFNLAELVFDFTLYPRNELSSQHISILVDAVRAGATLPPLIVDRKSKRIVDGFHRAKAYEDLGTEEVEVILNDYATDAELFADAVRLNAGHGRAFDNFDRRRAVLRLAEFGFTPEQISKIARVPLPRIEEIQHITAVIPGGRVEIVKGGLRQELVGHKLTKAQEELNNRWSGMQPAYHVRQLLRLLQAKVIPESENFALLMDELVSAWAAVRRPRARKAS